LSPRRAVALLALLVAVVGALLFTAPGRGYWVIDPDAAAYVGLARSVVAGDGYALQGVPHGKFPPGFPGVLALAISVTGDPACYGAMRDLVTLFGLLDVVLAYAVGRRVLKLAPGGALLLAFASATSIYLVQYSVAYLRSETLFTACFLGALLAGESWRERCGWRGALAAGLLCAAAVSVRSAGLAAIAGIALARLFGSLVCCADTVSTTHGSPRHSREGAAAAPRGAAAASRPPAAAATLSDDGAEGRDDAAGAGRGGRFGPDLRPGTLAQVLLFAALGVAPMLAQKAYVSSRSAPLGAASSDYGDELFAAAPLDLTKNVDVARPTIEPFSSAMAERVRGNLAALGLSLGKFVANDNRGANLAVSSRNGALHPGGYALLLLLALGLVAAARAGLVRAVASTLVYLGLYAIWPFNQQQRFYQPLAPVLLVLLAWGARPVLGAALRAASSRAGRIALAVGTMALALGLAAIRSDSPVVAGRWSRTYAVLIAGVWLAGIVLGVLAVRLRSRTLDLSGARPVAERIALAMLALAWVVSFSGSLRELRAEHAAFLAQRAARPVAPRFEHIKTNPELLGLLDALLTRARKDDLVMTDIPKMVHELTGLRTTPLRFDTSERTLVLDTPQGRPNFLYYSPELPDVSAMIDAWRLAHPGQLVAEHSVELHEGALTIPLALYRVAPQGLVPQR